MARTISIGTQGFEDIRANGDFYVDKTGFVRDCPPSVTCS